MNEWQTYAEPKKLPFGHVKRKHTTPPEWDETSRRQKETSGETGERPQHKQHQRFVAGDPEHHRLQSRSTPIMCDVMLPYERNSFYARFDLLNNELTVKSTPPPDDWPLSVYTADARRTLPRVTKSKAAGPDYIPGRVLRTCAIQLAVVITDIFNTSLSQESVPTCFKTAPVLTAPVLKMSAVSCLNDYHSPRFWWSAFRNCFSSTSKTPSQPAWTLTCLHSEPTDLQRTQSPLPSTQSSHTLKVTTPTSECCLLIPVQHSIQSPPWNWLANLTLWAWVPHSETGYWTSSQTDARHHLHCVLSPLLFTLCTYDCSPQHGENSVVKFADHTTIGHI